MEGRRGSGLLNSGATQGFIGSCGIDVLAFALSCLDGPSSSDDGHRNNADKETPGDHLGPAMRLEDHLKICGGPTSIERDASGPDLNGVAQVVREHRQTLEAANPPEVVGAMASRDT